MIVTEKEAKTKLCPQTLARGPMQHAGNYDLETCLGSHCMAWRWSEAVQPKGYCGMAGRPT